MTSGSRSKVDAPAQTTSEQAEGAESREKSVRPASTARGRTETEADPPMTLRLFGRFEARVHGRLISDRLARREGWLLCILILRRERPTDRDWLASMLWPESDEENARFYVRRSLHALRKALGDQAPRLLCFDDRSLRFDPAGVDCDLVRFDAAAARGDTASLQAALACYGGPLLENCLEEWAIEERRRCETAFTQILEGLAQERLRNGDPQGALAYLHRLTAVDPLSEPVQRLLLQALAEAGDATGLIRAFRSFRQVLHEQLQASPEAETLALYQKLRSQSRTMRTSPTAAVTPPIHRGYLPRPSTALIGRKAELEEIRHLLDRSTLVTITGAGGVGKTRLAIEAASVIEEYYSEGAWFVDLSQTTDPALIPSAIASLLRVQETPGRTLLETLTEFLRSKRLLLVLDNCEHLLPACARLAADLLMASPGLRILATSREPLHIDAEQVWRTPSLSLPDPAALSDEKDPISVLMDCSATRLLLERAYQYRPDFTLTRRNAGAAAEICRRLDGIALAIELAAARVTVLTVEQIAARLEDRFRLLTSNRCEALPRHQTLRGMLDWSYELLSKEERTLLSRLSVFSGGWTLEAATRIGMGEEADEYETLDLLSQLVDKSLVNVEEAPPLSMPLESRATEVRYRMLETVRQYAAERLQASGEDGRTRGRHLDWFLALAEEAEARLRGAEQAIWLQRLEMEHDNLRGALAWSRRHPVDVGLRLAGALQRFWAICGHYDEGRKWLAAALDRGDEGSEPARARARNGAGHLAHLMGDYEQAKREFNACLVLHERAGNSQGVAVALNSLGNVAHRLGDYEQAREYFRASLEIKRTQGDLQGAASSLNNLGNIASDLGDFAEARSRYEESLQILRQLGDEQALGAALCNLGCVAHDLGDSDNARAWQEESLAIRRKVGDRQGIAASLNNLGNLAYDRGDLPEARRLFEESLAIEKELNNREGVASSLNNLGNLAIDQGDFSLAWTLHKESLTLRSELGVLHGIAQSLESIAAMIAIKILDAEEEAGAFGDDPRCAVRLWGASAALQEKTGVVISPEDQKWFDRKKALMHTRLDEPIWTQAWAEGAALSMEDAISEALAVSLDRSKNGSV